MFVLVNSYCYPTYSACYLSNLSTIACSFSPRIESVSFPTIYNEALKISEWIEAINSKSSHLQNETRELTELPPGKGVVCCSGSTLLSIGLMVS